MNDQPVYVSLEFTPNPNTLKYSVNRELLKAGVVSYEGAEQAREKSPLAAKILEIDGISNVMVGRDFVTITKADNGDWDQVHQKASSTLESHLTQGEPVFTAEGLAELQGDVSASAGEQSEEVQKIVEFLETQIRPAVAQDGGDIAFQRFEEGILYLHMQGSCAGCPSSTATLKMGIEQRLKEVIPTLKEVVAL